MLIILNSAAMTATLDRLANDDPVKPVLQQRANELAEYSSDISDVACFALIEPGDTLVMIEAALNVPIATNAIDGFRYGDPDFTPCWEWIMDHGRCWEMPFIMTDDGFGHVVIVPDSEGIDPVLLKLCREYGERPEGTYAPS